MEEPGSLRVLLDITGCRPLQFQRSKRRPVKKPVFSTTARAVAMDALACGYKAVGSLCHGRVGAGLTLTLDMGVYRITGQPPDVGRERVKKKAKGNVVTTFFRLFFR